MHERSEDQGVFSSWEKVTHNFNRRTITQFAENWLKEKGIYAMITTRGTSSGEEIHLLSKDSQTNPNKILADMLRDAQVEQDQLIES